MMWASVVLPSPGGPHSRTCSTGSSRRRAASSRMPRFSRTCTWPTYSARNRGRSARQHVQRRDCVESRLELDDHLGRCPRSDTAGTPDGRCILAHDGALEHLEAGRTQDVQPDLRPDPVDLDQHLEKIELFDRCESVHRELVVAHLRVDVQLHLAARRRKLLPRLRRDGDHVANASNVEHDKISARAADDSTQMCDHLVAALVNFLLRAWHTAIAIASRAWSSSRPSG